MKHSDQEFPALLFFACLTILASILVLPVKAEANQYYTVIPDSAILHFPDTEAGLPEMPIEDSKNQNNQNSPNWNENFWHSIIRGNITLNNRFRTELVRVDGLDNADAITNRLQLGYGTLPWYGISTFVDFVDVRPVGVEKYNAAGLNNQP
ncbi:MAG: hypothetical protein EA359_11150 [Balneolaceae bacterium]|nr:MAG: hypothetical protein EA359_11150 [Balneolaceae bacterium]